MVKMKTETIILSAAMFLLPLCSEAAIHKTTLPEVEKVLESAAPGDTIAVSPGTYRDLSMKWEGRGTAEAPIVVTAEIPGGTVITGSSVLNICGSHLVVSSFLFKDGMPVRSKGALVQFRNGDSLARNCRLTGCVIDSYNATRRDHASSYVFLYGRQNRVDHCSFIGKKSLGVTLIVWLNYEGCIDNHHSIDQPAVQKLIIISKDGHIIRQLLFCGINCGWMVGADRSQPRTFNLAVCKITGVLAAHIRHAYNADAYFVHCCFLLCVL